ncbi:MAG: hypothetical protein AB1715_03240, partial [Acidobacteriota bacterium]
MYSKKLSRIAVAGRLAVLVSPLLSPGYPQVVDCILAEINNRIITLADIQVLAAFSPATGDAGKPSPPTLRQILEEAINRKVVLDLVRENVVPTEDEVGVLMKTWKEQTDPEEWQRKLAGFGFAEDDLKPYLEELVLFNKIIELRFTPSFDVNLQEIETYYNEAYVPAERALG